MRSGFFREIESPRDRIHQVRLGGVLGSLEQFLSVQDLDLAALGGSVASIYAIALGSCGHGAVHIARLEARRARLLPGQAEVANKNRLRSEEHTSELQSHLNLVCRLLLEKKKDYNCQTTYDVYYPQSA